MKRIFVFSLISWALLSACNNDKTGTGSTSGTDTGSVPSNNTSSTGAMASTAAIDTGGQQPFMAVMNKMMQDMHSMQMTGDADHDFAMMMRHHHQGAIEMSNIEIAQGKNTELKQVAQKIINDSQKDNKTLDSFLTSHQPRTTGAKSNFGSKAMQMMMKDSMHMMMKDTMHMMKDTMHMGMGMSGGMDVDQQFAMMMAKHHQHGIDMAREYLKSAREQATRKVANSTIKNNSDDLKKLKAHQGGHKAGAH